MHGYVGTHFLPDEDSVDEGAAAEDDAETYKDRRDDRRRRLELNERVQDHTYTHTHRQG